ncbi:MAG: FAD-dependent oxidoreductase [Deltaproteobacteria bacterium]|nr:FAD-dependent oxidoreductase [Deltaproteobacteria bacterium]
MKTKHTKYVVIGLGPAGMACTLMANSMGIPVTAIEKRKIGGECLNYGCIPSKALIKACRVKYLAKHSDVFGFRPSELQALEIFKRVRDVVHAVNVGKTVKMFETVDLILGKGEARFINENTVEVADQKIQAKKIFLCLGTSPKLPTAVPGFEKINYLTNETVFDLDDIPRSIIVLGGGPIGCELGQCFARLGSKVTIVNSSTRLLPKADIEASQLLEQVFRSEGIDIFNNVQVISFNRGMSGEVIVSLSNGIEINAEKILIAIGRKMDYSSMNLENAGIKWSSNGIEVNDHLQTTNPCVYAVGDCNGYKLFTHSAMHQGMIAIINSLIPNWLGVFRKNFKRFVVPWSVFTEPEVSSVGLTESELRNLGLKYDSVMLKYADYGRALADGSEIGFVKVYFKKGVRPTVLGATIVGENSAEMIHEWALSIQKKLTLFDIMFLQHSFPTFSFLNKRIPEQWMMNLFSKTSVLKKFIQKMI